MSPYIFIARTRVLVALAYRFEVVASFCGQFVIMLTALFLWRKVYANTSSVAGVSGHDMLLYVVLSSALVLFFTGNIADRLRTRIRSGDISLDLVRPVYLPALWLAEGVGSAFAILLIQGVPLLLGAWFLIGSLAPHSCVTFLLFLPAAWLSYLIIWLMGSIVSLVAFWALELGSIVHAQEAAVRFLSGSIVPVWFFPASFQAVLAWTPFIYTYQGTIGIYLGRYSPTEAVRIIAIQAVWVFLLGGIFVILWHQARRKVIVQGG